MMSMGTKDLCTQSEQYSKRIERSLKMCMLSEFSWTTTTMQDSYPETQTGILFLQWLLLTSLSKEFLFSTTEQNKALKEEMILKTESHCGQT